MTGLEVIGHTDQWRPAKASGLTELAGRRARRRDPAVRQDLHEAPVGRRLGAASTPAGFSVARDLPLPTTTAGLEPGRFE